MRIALIIAVVALTGCQSAQQLRALAPQQSDYEICRASMQGGNQTLQTVAWEERNRRSLDCGPYMASIQMQQQNDANRAALGLMLMQQARPQPVYQAPALPLPPQPISCSSRNVMGTVYTDCR